MRGAGKKTTHLGVVKSKKAYDESALVLAQYEDTVRSNPPMENKPLNAMTKNPGRRRKLKGIIDVTQVIFLVFVFLILCGFCVLC